MGPAAESEVIALLNHPREDVRSRARAILKSYNTKDSVLLDRIIDDLSSPDNNTRRSALEWLAQRKAAEEARRADVSRALETVLKDNDRQLVELAIKALEVWGTGANVESLVRIAADTGFFQTRGKAIDVLGRIKDPEAAKGLILLLTLKDDKLALQARDSLQLMGAAAEKPLTDYGIKSTIPVVRAHCWHVLTFVAGKDNIKELKMLASKETPPPVKKIAEEACKQIEMR